MPDKTALTFGFRLSATGPMFPRTKIRLALIFLLANENLAWHFDPNISGGFKTNSMLKHLVIDLESITTVETYRDHGDWVIMDFYGPTEALVKQESDKYSDDNSAFDVDLRIAPRDFGDHWYARIKRRRVRRET